MTLILLEAVPPGLRGELTRWLTALRPTVFIGRLTPTVRELLWEQCTKKSATGQVIMAWSTPSSERGFEFRCHGVHDMVVVDLEGLLFPCTQDAAWREASERFGLRKRTTDP